MWFEESLNEFNNLEKLKTQMPNKQQKCIFVENKMMYKNIFWVFCLLGFVSCRGLQEMEKAEESFQTLTESTVLLTPKDQFSRSSYGNYQLKVSGSPYEIGYKTGKLTDSLYRLQERIFFDKVKEMTGTAKKQKFLLNFLRWYHRDMTKYVSEDYQKELYGLSQFSSGALDSLATPFQRAMMLHGAHDIGHAMQDLMLVGCSSVAVHNSFSSDGSLWIARNFDFYVSDEFAENKIIAFVEPDQGYNYVSVTWPGMLGVVSGMNEKGLTVTINAGKSSIPLKAKQPVSLVVKEILQYASTIAEAQKIAFSKELFVSEALLVGSATDNKAVIIELSPKKQGIYESENDFLICTNHFQSAAFQKDKRNIKHKLTSHSEYRFQLIDAFMQKHPKIDEVVLAKMLRKTSGLNNKDIGYGNEKALNQLLAHHAVIFHPETLQMWVSNAPYQLGAFEMYDLHNVVENNSLKTVKEAVVAEDTFLHTKEFQNVLEYRLLLKQLIEQINAEETVPLSEAHRLTTLNPEFWQAYFWAGRIAFSSQKYQKAVDFFETAFNKEVSTKQEEASIEKWIKKCQKKIKKRPK